MHPVIQANAGIQLPSRTNYALTAHHEIPAFAGTDEKGLQHPAAWRTTQWPDDANSIRDGSRANRLGARRA